MQPIKPSAAPRWENPTCRTLEYQIVAPGEAPDPRNWKLIGVDSKWREHTADCALFLWRNGQGMWNASSLQHLQRYLKTSAVERLQDEAEDLQLVLASGTADKLQQVLVGYVSQ